MVMKNTRNALQIVATADMLCECIMHRMCIDAREGDERWRVLDCSSVVACCWLGTKQSQRTCRVPELGSVRIIRVGGQGGHVGGEKLSRLLESGRSG